MATVTMQPVQFHGDTIYCVEQNEQPYTAVKPIVENMGLAWQVQQRKLNENKERWGITIMVIPSKGGDQETTCMPVRKLPAFMASINPKKVRPELREKIELYQNECDDALWDYWTKGHAERKAPSPALEEDPTPSTPADREPLRRLVDAWSRATGKAHAALWPQVTSYFGLTKISELPRAWVSDAIKFVQARIDGAQIADKPAPTSLKLPVVDDETIQRGRCVFSYLNDIANLAKRLEIAVPVVAHPGCRDALLSDEKEALYSSARSHYLCLCHSIETAYESAVAIYRMKKSIKFVTPPATR